MSDKAKILAVDDDPRVCRLLHRYLSQEGFRVSTASNGSEMREQMAATIPDLVILDLMLPEEDGLTLARELRANHDVGIIMLTGKTDTIDKIVGLEMGADDYITKPFDERELLARVRSVLRRARQRAKPGGMARDDTSVACFNGWRMDLKAYTLVSPAGEEVHLTSLEFQLLVTFVKHPNQALSRDTILDFISRRDYSPFDRSIDVMIGKLRKKIEPDAKQPTFIKTIRGTGYMFTPRVEFQRS